ncbi:MAG: hypothetical protein ACI9G1_002322 [Pirellulaceae bacterium]|jgi:hypothetical protein
MNSPNSNEIDVALEARRRLQKQQALSETPEQRMLRFAKLQKRAFETLRSSPGGWEHFLRRNYESRRVREVNGQWIPVSADRYSG